MGKTNKQPVTSRRIPSKYTASNSGSFSLARMRDTVTNCVDSLTKEMSRQVPDVDVDGFETDLRQLLLRYGNKTASVGNFYADASTVEAGVVVGNPPYNLAADVLVLANEEYIEGDTKGAVELLASLFETPGFDELVGALRETNMSTDLAVAAALSEASDSSLDENIPEDGSDDSSDDDNSDAGTEDDSDASDTDNSDDATDGTEELDENDIANVPVVHDDDDASSDDSSEESEESEASEADASFNELVANVAATVKPYVKKVVPMSREERAFLNKLAITGKADVRQQAKLIEAQAKLQD